MIRKINRIFQNYMRKKRLALGKCFWDRKEKKEAIKKGNFIENNEIKSILFLRYDGKIGDMVINTLMFKNIKRDYPNLKIGVVTKKGASELLKENPYVDKIYLYNKKRKDIKKLSQEIAKEKYDLLIDFSEVLRVNQMMFINRCKARFNMGLQREEWELFDLSYSYPSGNFHITELYSSVLEKIGVKNIDLSYDLYFSKEEKEKVDTKLLPFVDKEKFVLNPFAASKHREINRDNIKRIIEIILKKDNRVVFLIGEKSREKEIESIEREYPNKVVYLGLETITETAYLIEKSDFVITPDTSIVHISAWFKKKMIAIYRVDGKEENNLNKNLWAPNYKEAYQIYSIDEDIKVGEEPSINKFDLTEMDRIINY